MNTAIDLSKSLAVVNEDNSARIFHMKEGRLHVHGVNGTGEELTELCPSIPVDSQLVTLLTTKEAVYLAKAAKEGETLYRYEAEIEGFVPYLEGDLDVKNCKLYEVLSDTVTPLTV